MRKVSLAWLMASALLLTACGGGGGGGNGKDGAPITTISGTGAVGYPLIGATVKVTCVSGTPVTPNPSDAQGNWTMTVTDQKFPCAVQLTGGTANGVLNTTKYHALAMSTGIANLTPLTDLLVANVIGSATPATWFSALTADSTPLTTITQAKIDAALTKLRAAMPLLTPLASLNPITTAFTATTGNSTDDMLEALKSAYASTGVTHASLLMNAAIPGFTAPTAAFNSAITWAFRSTSSGGNAYHASTIVTAAPPATTYVSGSEDEVAFNLLGSERNRCGFGYLTQSTQVDSAARAHANWQLVNTVVGHYEDGTTYPTGFTGYSVLERIAFQGYTSYGGGNDLYSVRTGDNTKSGFGSLATRKLLAAPFHLRGLMDGHRDVGINVRNNVDAGSAAVAIFLQIDTAYKSAAGKQLQVSDAVLTYPCEGTTGVNYQVTAETPNPVPGRDLSALPLGHPVLIKVRDGNNLVISTATMTNVATSANVVLRSAAQTRADDAAGKFSYSEAYVVPDAPLAPSTSYRVTITGTNSDVPFTTTFTFTTGTGG